MTSHHSKTSPEHNTPGRTTSRLTHVALCVALTVAAIVAHFPAIYAGYTWDDGIWTNENSLNFTPGGLWKTWTSTTLPDYWPLTRTVFWIGWQLWGDNPACYHAVNIILHAVAAVLLWRVLRQLKLGEPGAFLAGLIFAIHPVTVESVAWISECKNGLSMVWYLCAILAYLRFEDDGRPRWYVFALLAATCALLAKTSVIMLPVIFLLLCWWRHQTITRRDIFRTVPFFLLSLVLGLVTIWFQHYNATGGDITRPEDFASRIASVGWIIGFYLYKIIIPVNLAMIYPRWDVAGHRVLSFIPLALLIVCFLVLWYGRKSWGRGSLAALGSFVIVLAPVLGLLEMSYARFSLVADHLQYPGMPGVIALIGGGLGAAWSWARQKHKKVAGAGIAALVSAIVLVLAVLTWRQAWIYRDNMTLWSHTIELNDRAWSAYAGRGNFFADEEDWERAMQDYMKAVELKPDEAGSFVNRGNAYASMGNYDLAIKDYDKVIELDPKNAKGYHNRGMTYGRMNEFDKAISDITRAIELKSDYFEAYSDRGTAYYGVHAYELAISDYTKAIELKPDDPDSYVNRGNVFNSIGDLSRAVQDYNQAINLEPDNAKAYNHRGSAYSSAGDYPKAIENYTHAIDLQPDYEEAYCNRGTAYGRLRDYDRAIDDFTRAIELKPDYTEAYFNRGVAFGITQDYGRAIQDYTKAIELQLDHVKAYTNRGNIYHGLRDYAQAVKDHTKAIELQPDYVDAYNNRGAAYHESRDYEHAVRDYSKAIELQPNYAKAYNNRASTYYAMRAYDKARADIVKCKQLGGRVSPNLIKALAKASSQPGPPG